VARGWESKAIESQQEDRGTRRPAGPALTAEERDRRDRAESVALALADATAQLQAACRPAQRDLLHERVRALQSLLAGLQTPPALTPERRIRCRPAVFLLCSPSGLTPPIRHHLSPRSQRGDIASLQPVSRPAEPQE
jgi:hypothetical protein